MEMKPEAVLAQDYAFSIPENAESGSTIHMLAKATDDGAHNLSRYQRVIITVA